MLRLATDVPAILCACAIALASLAVPASAQESAAAAEPVPAPRFAIQRFDIEGNTLLPAAALEKAVAPYVGGDRDFGDIQRALETLEELYRGRGYGVVQVLLPEQDITRGAVKLRVIEPVIGKITIEGNRFYDETNIRRSLPTVKPGVTPDSRAVGQNLQLLTENPSKQTTLLLKAGASDAEIDAAIKVADERPYKFVATLDNTGTNSTGYYRVGFAAQHSNLFNRDHIGTLQYVTSPDNPSKVKIYGAGYRIPLYQLDSSIDIFGGYSDVSSGALSGLFNVSGSGTILGARYNYQLPRAGEYEHKLSAGLDYRAYKNNVVLLGGGGGLVPDVTVHPASVSYSGLWRLPSSEFGLNFGYVRNIPGGSDGSDADFKASRADATAQYSLFRYGANFTQLFAGEWQFRAVLTGQYSRDALVSGEQFGFGGPDSVRGFNVRQVANDKGYSSQLEVYTPDIATKLGWPDVKLRLLAFYDMGITGRNNAQPGESWGQGGGSIGFGARGAIGKSLTVRLDVAQVLDEAGGQARNSQMLNFLMALQF